MMEIAEEPHLHMEVTVKGLQVDPMEYFAKSVAETLMGDSNFEDDTTPMENPMTTPSAK